MPFLAETALASVLLMATALANAAPGDPVQTPPTQAPSAQQDAASLSRQAVRAAVATVAADPDLPGTTTEKKLRFKPGQDTPKADTKTDTKTDNTRLRWLRDLLDNLTGGARVLMWLLGAAAVVWVLLRLRTWARLRAEDTRRPHAPVPSHVGSLDIRPQSLPDDIGTAATSLWQQGQHRAALSLLYRGAVSRLVHAHAVPIRTASTEGDCLALAQGVLAGDRQAFFARLVVAWQAAAYAGRLPSADEVQALCGGFDHHLGAASAHAHGRRPA